MDINRNSETQNQIPKIEFLGYFFKATETYLHIDLCICYSFSFSPLTFLNQRILPSQSSHRGFHQHLLAKSAQGLPALKYLVETRAESTVCTQEAKKPQIRCLHCRLVEKPATASQMKLQKGLMNTVLDSRF